MNRYAFHPAVGVGAAAVFIGHLGLYMLPATLIGLPTPILLVAGVTGSILWAVRYL